MKKILFALLAVALCLVSCKKDETVTPTGVSAVSGTVTATSVTLPNNLASDKSIAASMPKSNILNAFKLSEDEFNAAWTNGQIEFGAIKANEFVVGSTLEQGKWGHCFDENGVPYSYNDSRAVVRIEGASDPFSYKVTFVGDCYKFLKDPTTINCTQAFQYTSEANRMTEVIKVPWKITLTTAEYRIVDATTVVKDTSEFDPISSTVSKTVTIEKAKDINVDIATAPAYAVVDGKVTSTKGDTLYFTADGKVSTQQDAVVWFYKSASVWSIKCIEKTLEGKTPKISVAFVNDTTNLAVSYTHSWFFKERTFAKLDTTYYYAPTSYDTLKAKTNAGYTNAKMLSKLKVVNTLNQKSFKFDFPDKFYKVVTDSIAAKAVKDSTLYNKVIKEIKDDQKGGKDTTYKYVEKTIVELVNEGVITITGLSNQLSTASPYGHWFDRSALYCNETAVDRYCSIVYSTDSDTKKNPLHVTYSNVPGADREGDTGRYIQKISAPKLGLIFQIITDVEVKSKVD